MTDQAQAGDLSNKTCALDGHSSSLNSQTSSEMRELMASMMNDMVAKMRDDMLEQFQAYVEGGELHDDCDEAADEPSEDQTQTGGAMDDYLHHANADEALSLFAELAAEFSTSDKTGPAIDDKLEKLITELCTSKLPKEKIKELVGSYWLPENCDLLVAPKMNKVVSLRDKIVPLKSDCSKMRSFKTAAS